MIIYVKNLFIKQHQYSIHDFTFPIFRKRYLAPQIIVDIWYYIEWIFFLHCHNMLKILCQICAKYFRALFHYLKDAFERAFEAD